MVPLHAGSRSGTPGPKVGFKKAEDDYDIQSIASEALTLDGTGRGTSATPSTIRFAADSPDKLSYIPDSTTSEGHFGRSYSPSKSSYERCTSPTFTIISDYGSEWTVPGPEEAELARLQDIREEEDRVHMLLGKGVGPQRAVQSAVLPARMDTAGRSHTVVQSY